MMEKIKKLKMCKGISKGINGYRGIKGIVLILVTLHLLVQISMAIPQFPNNSCTNCHRDLLFSTGQKQFTDIRINHLKNGIACSIDCHEDRVNQSIDSSYALWSISSHALFNVTCDKCHGGNPIAASKKDAHVGLSNDSIARVNTPDTCGKCHNSQLQEFKSSLHFQRLESEDIPAPACVTCHQAHSVNVLTASEIDDFCSNCHNNITGIDPTVPKRAENALTLASELRQNYSEVNKALITAKANGQNVDKAEIELDSADVIIKNIPSIWHRFNLTYFEEDLQQGITYTQNAENMLNESSTTPTPKSPGFEGIVLIVGLILFRKLKLPR